MIDISHLTMCAATDHGALIDMAYSAHLTDAGARHIASRALDAAIEDAAIEDSGIELSPVMYAAALTLLIGEGWAARERKQQSDMAEDQEIWVGAARYEEAA